MYTKLFALLLLSTLTYSSLFITYKTLVHSAAPTAISKPLAQEDARIYKEQHIPDTDHVKGLEAQVAMSAVVGSGKHFTLYGYTSPGAQVILEGRGIHEETTSGSDGYYGFDNMFSPITSQEVCISSVDTVGRLSNQVCLPPLPINYNANIGPIILSPSISVDKGDVFIGQRVVLTGKTIPNTPVVFSFFKDEKKSLFTSFLQQIEPLLPSSVQRKLVSVLDYRSLIIDPRPNIKHQASSIKNPTSNIQHPTSSIKDPASSIKNTSSIFPLIKTVQAFTFPELKTVSDKDGNYSIELPTSTQSFLRTFAQVQFQNAPSEKSRTLNIKILPFWSILLTFITLFFQTIFGHIIATTFILELGILLWYFTNHFFHPYGIARSRVLMIYDVKTPMIPEKAELMRTDE